MWIEAEECAGLLWLLCDEVLCDRSVSRQSVLGNSVAHALGGRENKCAAHPHAVHDVEELARLDALQRLVDALCRVDGGRQDDPGGQGRQSVLVPRASLVFWHVFNVWLCEIDAQWSPSNLCDAVQVAHGGRGRLYVVVLAEACRMAKAIARSAATRSAQSLTSIQIMLVRLSPTKSLCLV